MTRRPAITAAILAGGRGSRLEGKDKGLVDLDGRPVLLHILERLEPQIDALLINANRNAAAYEALAADAGYSCRVVADDHEGFQGPLAGMAASLAAAETELVAVVPCDSPFVPDDLIRRLWGAMSAEEAEIAVAHDGERMQPVFALIPKKLLPSLLAFLESGQRKIDRWYAEHRVALASFDDRRRAFLNINTPEDYELIRQRLADRSGRIACERPLLGFAANSGVGKTTLLCKVLELLKARDLRVAVLKHAHHSFEIDRPGKDSFVLRKAGASQMLIASSQRWALIVEEPAWPDDTYPDLSTMLDRLDLSQVDLVLVEGFRLARFPKIELHRASLDHPWIHPEDPDIVAIATDAPADIAAPLPVIDLSDPEALVRFILEFAGLGDSPHIARGEGEPR